MAQEPLKFIVAPHIVQDLGLNLYTSLPRVLVEFIANAYDADSPYADDFTVVVPIATLLSIRKTVDQQKTYRMTQVSRKIMKSLMSHTL